MRQELFERICELVGAPVTRIVDAGDGWPGLVTLRLPSGQAAKVALHVSTVSPHSRRDYEFRFQNPASGAPVSAPRGYLPILVGLEGSGGQELLVGVDGRSRLGRHARFSILFNRSLITEARATGWAVYTSAADENIYAFPPSMLPVSVEMASLEMGGRPAIDASGDIAIAINSAGLSEDDSEVTRDRARRSVQVLIRDHAFRKEVVEAYRGECAMCGMDFGLVVGAHILPASAPRSPDRVWNGLALCHNHHAAFDNHRIWVDPKTREIVPHPEFTAGIRGNSALRAFLRTTLPRVAEPARKMARPREEMFVQRYRLFEAQYEWLT